MRRVALVFALMGLLVLSLLSSSHGTWAAPGLDPLHQTVPTRTPTSGPRTPRPSTPTEEPVVDTATPAGPTVTATPQKAPTVTATVEASATPAAVGTISPGETQPSAAPGRGWDFGDAPDPGFPSLEINDGARHAIISFEWLGDAVDGEPDSRQIDLDLYDDGVVLGELRACTKTPVEIRATVKDRASADHAYDAQHLLYLNVLVDWDGDGTWGGMVHCPQGSVASEWAVRNLPIEVSSWPEGERSAVVPIELTAGPLTGQVWARFTLSYGEVVSGEDWDGRGEFVYGETEDYLITVDAPPTDTLEGPSPTPLLMATSVPDGTPPADVAVGPESWRPVLCFGSSLLLVGAALSVALLARRRGSRKGLMAAVLPVLALPLLGWLFYRSDFSPPGSAVGSVASAPSATPRDRVVPTATESEQSLVHSSTGAEGAAPAWSAVLTVDSTPEAVQSTPESTVSTPRPWDVSARDRFGFGVAMSPVDQYDVNQLHAGWYLNWGADPEPKRPGGMEFAQMVRVRGGRPSPSEQQLDRIARANPGSLWLIGNEPDVLTQDGLEPAEYARIYHDVYTLLKSADPTCQVAIGGVTQPTPLRLKYLDMVLDAYSDLYGQTIPVDVWNVHGFILREERGSWGVDIPPGMSVDQGRLFEMEDHDDVEIFQQQILDFRRWMAEKGERDKPLIVSEYGILLPPEYGFSHERVRAFMYASFDFFLTATDAELGYPADDNRLVQRWLWYSVSDTVYPAGNLFDPETGQITPLGLAYGSYAAGH
jgi:hypothetical protein